MKINAILFVSIGLCFSAFADGTATNEAHNLTKSEMRERVLMRTGGILLDKREAKGSLVFVNAQKRVHQEVIALQAERLERDVMFELEVKDGEPMPLKDMDTAFKKTGANAALFVVDDKTLPSMLVVPAGRWGVVNVGALNSDDPDDKTLAQRTAKEMARAISFLFGAGYALQNSSACVPITKPEDLDTILYTGLTLDIASAIQRTARDSFEIQLFKRCFYSKAYEDGWAPPPKNKYQESAKRWVDFKKDYLAGKNPQVTEEWQRSLIKEIEKMRSDMERGPTNPIEIPMPTKK
jgi:hypothetical protein